MGHDFFRIVPRVEFWILARSLLCHAYRPAGIKEPDYKISFAHRVIGSSFTLDHLPREIGIRDSFGQLPKQRVCCKNRARCTCRQHNKKLGV